MAVIIGCPNMRWLHRFRDAKEKMGESGMRENESEGFHNGATEPMGQKFHSSACNYE